MKTNMTILWNIFVAIAVFLTTANAAGGPKDRVYSVCNTLEKQFKDTIFYPSSLQYKKENTGEFFFFFQSSNLTLSGRSTDK